jgi:hypothetical protein
MLSKGDKVEGTDAQGAWVASPFVRIKSELLSCSIKTQRIIPSARYWQTANLCLTSIKAFSIMLTIENMPAAVKRIRITVLAKVVLVVVGTGMVKVKVTANTKSDKQTESRYSSLSGFIKGRLPTRA